MSHRLILTSNGLTTRALLDECVRFLGGEDRKSKSVWYIPTAPLRDGWSQSQVKQQMAQVQRQLGVGKLACVDPEYVTGDALKQQVLQECGGKVDLIYAEMGNTYNLAHHLRQSGGRELISELMDAGAAYVGASAGAIMAGKTIQMAFWKNWDDKTCEGNVNPAQWDDAEVAAGLNLAGGRSIFPHANGQYASQSWQQQQAQKHGHTDHEVVCLPDGAGIVLDGQEVRCYDASGRLQQ